MDKPKIPCRSDCEYRSAHCHNATCPYGWADYEADQLRFLDMVHAKQDRYWATFPLTDARKRLAHKNILRKKQQGKLKWR